MIVAIDGPAGAGKSTIGRQLAERIGFQRVDTGSLYRAVAYACMQAGVDGEGAALDATLADLALDLGPNGEVMLAGADITEDLRTPEVSKRASFFAAFPAVRAALLGLQRRIGHVRDSVLEGRDIGTVVFPSAAVKIYLTASASVRAQRRLEELEARGVEADLKTVLAEIEARDHADMNREVAPLKKAQGAIEVDASSLSIDKVVDVCAMIVSVAQEMVEP
ncbi:MAG: cytidylate kinase [Bradymonadia bacterium]|jgi:cytidylate kinase